MIPSSVMNFVGYEYQKQRQAEQPRIPHDHDQNGRVEEDIRVY